MVLDSVLWKYIISLLTRNWTFSNVCFWYFIQLWSVPLLKSPAIMLSKYHSAHIGNQEMLISTRLGQFIKKTISLHRTESKCAHKNLIREETKQSSGKKSWSNRHLRISKIEMTRNAWKNCWGMNRIMTDTVTHKLVQRSHGKGQIDIAMAIKPILATLQLGHRREKNGHTFIL